jgi:nitroreductase
MELLDALRATRPCRQFLPKPLPAEKVKAVLAAARLAPSQNNSQPWRFVVVQDDEVKRLLAQACVRGKPVAEAPVAVVAFAVEEDVPMTVGGYISAYPLDVATAIAYLQAAAAGEGLGSAWIIDFHEEKVRAVLHAPEGVHPIAVIPLGYPAPVPNGAPTASDSTGRKSPDEIIAYNEYPW